jgi:hypothetical protein
MPVLVEALAADFQDKALLARLDGAAAHLAYWAQPLAVNGFGSHIAQMCFPKEKKREALEAQISRDFDALSTDLAKLEKMSWY